ncbi:MAG: 5'-nucleotidase C-terminal domain-containing protein [Chloroflexota bacterium]
MIKKKFFPALVCILLLSVIGCEDTAIAPTPADTDEPTAVPALRSTPEPTSEAEQIPTAEPAAEELVANEPEEAEPTAAAIEFPKRVLVLYTNDEHGWMEGVDENLGAANLMGTWAQNHDLDSYDAVIKISGGDMWTGPAISTWFSGESMVEVLNAMDYTAATVGNHEFDFGLEQLTKNGANSTFPFVSANIRWQESGETPTDLNIQPFTIQDFNGLKVGITGLTTGSTPQTTNPINVRDFEFLGYAEALQEIVPQMEAADADLILVPGHICLFELRLLAVQVSGLPIDLMGGGHCNELYADTLSGIPTLIGGSHMAAYSWAELMVDESGGELIDIGQEWTSDEAPADSAVAEIVGRWQDQTDAALNIKIGELQSPLARRGIEQQAMITESWLWWFPTADVAFTNLGGFRADLTAGDVTQGTIINVFPFNNVVIEVDMTGEQLINILNRRADDLAIGGVKRSGRDWVFKSSGESLDPSATYTILVNDFMFAGGDGYENLAQIDPEGYNTAVDWRQPLIDWISDGDGSQTLEQRISDLIVNGAR